MLERDNTVLVLVDVQAKLVPAMAEPDALIDGVRKLVRGMGVLGIPVVWTEQNPAGLGPTVAEVAELLTGEPITKTAFGCCGQPAFVDALAGVGRKQVLLAGIEAHVCVYQTACGLLDAGYEVQVVADAIGSRLPSNKAIACAKMAAAGAAITSVEMALFELLAVAEGPEFKDILKIVK